MSSIPWPRLLGVVAVVVALDQFAKTLVVQHLGDSSVHVLGPLDLTKVYNSGIAFGLANGYAQYLVAAAIIVIVFVLIRQEVQIVGVTLIAVGLVIGGALGNLIDRIFRSHNGAVVDYIDFWRWPVFNIADMAVVVGAFTLAFAGARKPVDEEAQTADFPNKIDQS